MESRSFLRVRVNDELALDGGWWEEALDYRCVHPPAKTKFEQLIDYLSAEPQPSICPHPEASEEAVAATAVCLRWGCYLVVSADREKPQWSKDRDVPVSRIDDSEMRRINIEASAALESWVDLMCVEPERYCRLVRLASHHLPMTIRDTKIARDSESLLALAHPATAAQLTVAVQPEVLEKARADAQAHPTRVLTTGIINFCWRNGPIEDIHAGQISDCPLMQRRITPSEEKMLMRETASRPAQGIVAVSSLIREESKRSWCDRVLPFRLVPFWMVTPTKWSLEKRTCGLQLPGLERLRASAND